MGNPSGRCLLGIRNAPWATPTAMTSSSGSRRGPSPRRVQPGAPLSRLASPPRGGTRSIPSRPLSRNVRDRPSNGASSPRNRKVVTHGGDPAGSEGAVLSFRMRATHGFRRRGTGSADRAARSADGHARLRIRGVWKSSHTRRRRHRNSVSRICVEDVEYHTTTRRRAHGVERGSSP